jgi:hypothetical protein
LLLFELPSESKIVFVNSLVGVEKKTAWKKLITPVRLIDLKSRCLAWSSETIVGNRFVSLAATQRNV